MIELEPDAFADRHRRALAERRVTVAQGPDGIGYVTGEMTAADAAAVDAVLSVAARDLGAEDPRTEQQRRADIFTDILLGRLRFTDADGGNGEPVDPATAHWLEVEDIDSDTGELLGTHRERVDLDGAATLVPELSPDRPDSSIRFVRRPLSRRVGVVVPLSSLLGLTDTAAELTDRSGAIPGEALRDAITDALGAGDPVLFTRLLTDDGGRLLDSTELGRYASRRLAEAIRVRAGTCRHPTCTVPAGRCDLDHLVPHPQGTTSADNLEPACRRHHRGKTFAWLAAIRDGDTTTWTLPDQTSYRVVDDPLPTGITPGRARGNDRGGGSGRPRRRRRPRRARSRPGSGATSPPCPRRQ